MISHTTARWSHERLFVLELMRTAETLGHRLITNPKVADLHIQWGVHTEPPACPTLYCELGWLPRWSYQVSHGGINADHHLAQPTLEPLDDEQRWKADCLIKTTLTGRGMPADWGYLYVAEPVPDSVPRTGYILAPLQMESDTNMRHVPADCATNQGFVDFVTNHVSRHAPEWPIAFKQHPNTQARSQRGLKMRRKGDKIYPHKQASVYAYLKDPRCVAVVTANSNVANDALLWDKPAVVFGRGIWPTGVFLKSLAHLDGWAVGAEMRRMYCYWLSRNQWTLRDAGDAQRVDAAIGGATA